MWILSFSVRGDPCNLIAFAETEEAARKSLLDMIEKDREDKKKDWIDRPITDLSGPFAPEIEFITTIDGGATIEDAIRTLEMVSRPLSPIFHSALDG